MGGGAASIVLFVERREEVDSQHARALVAGASAPFNRPHSDGCSHSREFIGPDRYRWPP